MKYLIDLNATQAAIRAGYSPKTANEQGARLLANVSIAQTIQKAMQDREQRTEITQTECCKNTHDLPSMTRASYFSQMVRPNPLRRWTMIPRQRLRDLRCARSLRGQDKTVYLLDIRKSTSWRTKSVRWTALPSIVNVGRQGTGPENEMQTGVIMMPEVAEDGKEYFMETTAATSRIYGAG